MLTCIHRLRLQHIRWGAIRDDGIKPASSGAEGTPPFPTRREHVCLPGGEEGRQQQQQQQDPGAKDCMAGTHHVDISRHTGGIFGSLDFPAHSSEGSKCLR